jgi:hypothetical protein
MAPDLVYKFQIICLRRTSVIEWKINVGWIWVKLNALPFFIIVGHQSTHEFSSRNENLN